VALFAIRSSVAVIRSIIASPAARSEARPMNGVLS
jgi:hypothetical protein